MKQPIVGGYPDNLQVNSAVTEYNCLMGGTPWTATEDHVYQCIPTNGKIRKLYVELNGDPTAGGSYYDFWLVVDGVKSTLTCRIAAGSTANSDLVHEVSVTAGQTVSICCTPSATDPTARMARWTVEFESDTAGESICLLHITTESAGTEYSSLQGFQSLGQNDESEESLPMPTAGSFKKLYIKLSAAPGSGAGDAYTFAFRVGEGTKNNTVTITQPATSGNITNVTDAVVAGNLVDFIITAVSTPSAEPEAAIGIVFCPTVDGESLLFGGSSNAFPDGSDTEYLPLCELSALGWSTTEQFSLIQACTVKNLYVYLTNTPGGGNSYDISLNKDGGAASGLTVHIHETDTTGNDLAHTYVAGNGDTISLKSIPTSSPSNVLVRIGCVLYIEGIVSKTSAETGAGADASTAYPSVTHARSETGSGADAKADYPAVTHSRTEVGSGADKKGADPSVSHLRSETGAGADLSALLAAMLGAETGVGVEGILARAIVLAEIAAGIESLLSRDISLSDTGIGADVAELVKTILCAETGSAFENSYLRIIEGVVTSSDTGAGDDVSSPLTVEHLLSDTGAGIDALIARALFAQEYPTGAIDLATTITAALAGAEVGAGVELSLLSLLMQRADSGSGSDASSLLALFTGSDIGAGAEAITLLATMISLDTGAGVEAVLAMLKAAIDSGVGAEAMSLIGAVGRAMKLIVYVQSYRDLRVYTQKCFDLKVYTSEVP